MAAVEEDEQECRADRGRGVSGGDEAREEVEDGQVHVDDGEEEARAPRAVRDPGQPTQEEREEHDLTHIPYRPWCEHCVRGKAKRKPSLKIAGAYAAGCHARVRMDYAQLTENSRTDVEVVGDEEVSSENSLTMLVMQESQCRSVWAYAVEHKGSAEEWLAPLVVEDLETVGLKEEKLTVKSDQEPSVVDVLREVARQRQTHHGTSLDHSGVGESDSNATIERAIQDVEGRCRTPRSALETRIAKPVKIADSIVPWLVRHAASLITRCRVRPSGKTSLEMMRLSLIHI